MERKKASPCFPRAYENFKFLNANSCNILTSLFILFRMKRLRVVPLFETVKDLRGAGAVIRQLLSIDWYREHITKNHNGHQEVLNISDLLIIFEVWVNFGANAEFVCR